MLKVALTGNLGSGKSTVAQVWRESGVPVVSADDLAREAVRPGSSALEEIKAAFGPGILRPDGTLDRTRMRDLAFRDGEVRERLEAILHPKIAELRERWLEAQRDEGRTLVVSEIPLLFELGLEDDADVVVVVHAPEDTRLRRVVRDRGVRPDEARRMMAAQGNAKKMVTRADFAIENDGTLRELEARALDVLEGLKQRRERMRGGR